MELLVVSALLAFAIQVFKSREQAQRIAFLGTYLGKFRIEKLLEDLLNGYQRALGDADPDRQAQVWRHLEPTEQNLNEQFSRFVLAFAEVYSATARVSKLPMALPFVSLAIPAATFDLRKLLAVHGRGISQAVANAQGLTPKRKAFNLMAELLLMQHSCHWFCRSKLVASARMLARHQTSYAQLLDAVSPETRQAYLAVVQG
jgi:AcrR family transcriptional regulator